VIRGNPSKENVSKTSTSRQKSPDRERSGGQIAGRADPGVDYLAVKIPHKLAGAGTVPIVLTVDGFIAKRVTIDIK